MKRKFILIPALLFAVMVGGSWYKWLGKRPEVPELKSHPALMVALPIEAEEAASLSNTSSIQLQCAQPPCGEGLAKAKKAQKLTGSNTAFALGVGVSPNASDGTSPPVTAAASGQSGYSTGAGSSSSNPIASGGTSSSGFGNAAFGATGGLSAGGYSGAASSRQMPAAVGGSAEAEVVASVPSESGRTTGSLPNQANDPASSEARASLGRAAGAAIPANPPAVASAEPNTGAQQQIAKNSVQDSKKSEKEAATPPAQGSPGPKATNKTAEQGKPTDKKPAVDDTAQAPIDAGPESSAALPPSKPSQKDDDNNQSHPDDGRQASLPDAFGPLVSDGVPDLQPVGSGPSGTPLDLKQPNPVGNTVPLQQSQPAALAGPGNDAQLLATPLPEPGTLALIAVALSALLFGQRRRKGSQ